MKKIINGKSVGKFTIKDLFSQHEKELFLYECIKGNKFDIYIKKDSKTNLEILRLSFKNEPRRLCHIAVCEEDKEHKFLGKIGIGSTMSEVEKIAGPYYDDEDLDAMVLENYPGMAFELGERDEWPDDYWDEKEAPIITIGIFDPDFYLIDEE